jgi:hypothetical protein
MHRSQETSYTVYYLSKFKIGFTNARCILNTTLAHTASCRQTITLHIIQPGVRTSMSSTGALDTFFAETAGLYFLLHQLAHAQNENDEEMYNATYLYLESSFPHIALLTVPLSSMGSQHTVGTGVAPFTPNPAFHYTPSENQTPRDLHTCGTCHRSFRTHRYLSRHTQLHLRMASWQQAHHPAGSRRLVPTPIMRMMRPLATTMQSNVAAPTTNTVAPLQTHDAADTIDVLGIVSMLILLPTVMSHLKVSLSTSPPSTPLLSIPSCSRPHFFISSFINPSVSYLHLHSPLDSSPHHPSCSFILTPCTQWTFFICSTPMMSTITFSCLPFACCCHKPLTSECSTFLALKIRLQMSFLGVFSMWPPAFWSEHSPL